MYALPRWQGWRHTGLMPGPGREKPKRGRPSAQGVETQVRQAVADLLTEGLPVSLEQVAARSGVSRATLYRRWSDRSSLLSWLADEPASPAIVRFLLAESLADPELARRVRETIPPDLAASAWQEWVQDPELPV